REYSTDEEYTQAHEQYRGYVLFHRTQAAAAVAIDGGNPEAAIDAINQGMESLKGFFVAQGNEEQIDEDEMMEHLRDMEEKLRRRHHIGTTLQEQLNQAIAAEDYEKAAEIRDELRQKRGGNPGH